MLKAPSLACDNRRVESLKRLQLLDSPIEERFERIIRMGKRMLDVPIVAFTLVDDLRQTFKAVQGMQACDVNRDHSICGHVIAGDDLFIVPNTREDERFFDNPIVTANPGIGFYAGCPVRSPDGEAIGAICIIDHKPRDITSDQIQGIRDLVATVEAELRSSLMSNAQIDLLAQLNSAERQALIDPLTRIWNRNGINELLAKEWDTAIEDKGSVGIIMADIDHFKMINDTYGHPVGDEVIKHVAESLITYVGTDGFVGRIGGEEFLIVMTQTATSEPLASFADRVRSMLETTPVHTKSGDLSITLSFGAIEAYPRKADLPDPYVSLADKALYKAKQGGRNKVEFAYSEKNQG